MQTTAIRDVSGSNTCLATLAPPPAATLKFGRSGFEPRPANLVSAALPLDRWPCYKHRASPLLVAYLAKTFDPPPPTPTPTPPSKK